MIGDGLLLSFGNRRPRSRCGFTLLEAVLALVILSVVSVACLQLRGQMGLVGAQAQRRAAQDNRADALFTCLTSGMLTEPTADPVTGALVWSGEHLGTPYTIRRGMKAVPNPAAGQVNYPVASTVSVVRYEVTLGGTVTEFLWHR